MGAFVYLQVRYPKANNTIILTSLFALADLASDVGFSASLYLAPGNLEQDLELEKLLSVVFVGLPAGVNLCLLGWTLWQEAQGNSKWRAWWPRHPLALACAVFLGLANTGSFRILSSGILGARACSAPLSPEADYRLQMLGLGAVLLEDVPQLVLQVMVIRTQDSVVGMTLVALVFTCLAIFFGVGKRIQMSLSADKDWWAEDALESPTVAVSPRSGSGNHKRSKTAAGGVQMVEVHSQDV